MPEWPEWFLKMPERVEAAKPVPGPDGCAVIGGTIVPVWRFVDQLETEMDESGDARVAESRCMHVLGLTLEELVAAIRYWADHVDEINRDLVANLPDRYR